MIVSVVSVANDQIWSIFLCVFCFECSDSLTQHALQFCDNFATFGKFQGGAIIYNSLYRYPVKFYWVFWDWWNWCKDTWTRATILASQPSFRLPLENTAFGWPFIILTASGVGRGGNCPRQHFLWRGCTFSLGGSLGFDYLMKFELQFGIFKIIYQFWHLADSS